MHHVAVALVALAGVCYLVAAWRRLRVLSGGEVGTPAWLYLGVAAHTAGLVASLIDGGHAGFLFSALGVWAASASLIFLRRFIAAPSRGLLVLPLGGMALLLAVAALAPLPPPGQEASARGLVLVHVLFMATSLAAHLVAGGAAVLFLVAVGRLKRADASALTMPSLPVIDLVYERFLVAATALLLGGLATGGVIMRVGAGVSLTHPAVICSLADMMVLVAAFALRLAGRLGRRGMAVTAIAAALLAALANLSFVALRHG